MGNQRAWVKSAGVEFDLVTQAGEDQQRILQLLDGKTDVAMNVK
jgi:hypothetical protein